MSLLVSAQPAVAFVNFPSWWSTQLDEMVTSYGHPWWFTLPQVGVAEAGSQYPEALAGFPPEDAAAFVERVGALVASGR